MEVLSLEVQTRDTSEKAKSLLERNFIPLNYYGRGVQNKSLKVDYQTFRRLYKQAGNNTVIELNVDGQEKCNVIVHEVDTDPISDTITHVDLINVRMDEEIHTTIPLEFVGQAAAVKELSGIFSPNLSELDIKCLPKDLVHTIEVNIESLVDFNASIKVKDLIVPSAIKVMNDPEQMVAAVVPPREEEPEQIAPVGEVSAEGGAVAEENKEEAGESKSE